MSSAVNSFVPFAYVQLANGSVVRKPLSPLGAEEQLLPARTQAFPALSLYSFNGAMTLFAGEKLGFLRDVLQPGSWRQDYFTQPSTTVNRALVAGQNQVYAFNDSAGYAFIEMRPMQDKSVTPIWAMVDHKMMGGAWQPMHSPYVFVLVQSTLSLASEVHELSQGGSDLITLLSTYGAGQDLRKLALNSTGDTLYTYSKTLGQIMRIPLSQDTLIPTAIFTDSVTDMKVSEDGSLWWSNQNGLWASQGGAAGVNKLPGVAVAAFDLDLTDHRPTFMTHSVITYRSVPLSGSMRIPNLMNNNDQDGDILACTALPYGTTHSTLVDLGGCNIWLRQDQAGATSGMKDSVRVVLSDYRGGSDTASLSWSYGTNAPPVIGSLPALVIDSSYQERRIAFTAGWEVTDAASSQLLQETPPTDNTFTDTTCTSKNSPWIAQSFHAQQFGQLSQVTIGATYPGTMALLVVNDSIYQPGLSRVIGAELVPPGAGNVTTVDMSSTPWLSTGQLYSLVLVPMDASTTFTTCLQSTSHTQDGSFYDSWNPTSTAQDIFYKLAQGNYNPNGYVRMIYNGPPDSTKIGILPGKAQVGTSQDFRLFVDDGVARRSAVFTVQVPASNIPSPFAPPPTLQLGRRASGSPTTILYNWLGELAWNPPRSYNVEELGGGFFNNTPSIDAMSGTGNLVLDPVIGKSGTTQFRIQRCHTDTLLCSPWDTIQVNISTPPTLSVVATDTLAAGTTHNLAVTVSNPDPSVVTGANLSLFTRRTIASATSAGTPFKCLACAQSFVVPTYGSLQRFSVEASFPKDSVLVSVYRLSAPPNFSPGDGNTASLQSYSMVKVIPGVLGWQELSLPHAINLDSGSTFVIQLGGASAASPSDSLTWVISPDLAPGLPYNVVGGTSTVIGVAKDFHHKIALDLQPPYWAYLNNLGNGNWTILLKPSPLDTGSVTIAIAVGDVSGSSIGASVQVKVTPGSGTVQSSSSGASKDIRFPVTPADVMRHIWNPNGGSGTALAGFMFETAFPTSADSNFFAGILPTNRGDGSFDLLQRANLTGAARFMVRGCGPAGGCSNWDTLQVTFKQPPSLTVQLPTQLLAGTDTAITLTLRDPEPQDIGKLHASASGLRVAISQATVATSLQASAVGQTFKLAAPGNIGLLRVYARFPKPYVRVGLSDIPDSSGRRTLGFDFFATVRPDTLMWHDILVPNNLDLSAGKPYLLQAGYDSLYPVTWGVATGYADGSLSTGFDSSHPNGIAQAGQNLAFQVFVRQALPTASVTAGLDPVTWTLHLRPTLADTGTWLVAVQADDSTAWSLTGQAIRVLARASVGPTPGSTPFLRIVSEGQAVMFALGNVQSIASGQLKVHVTGPVDTILSATSSSVTWVPAPLGHYRVAWEAWSDAATLAQSGQDTFSVVLKLFTPPRGQTWYMVGFGADSVSFSGLKTFSQVFHWEDDRSPGNYNRYTTRTDLVSSVPGFGYWYYCEEADTITMPVLTSMPSTLATPLKRGATGWNMVANPWSWPISMAATQFSGTTKPTEFWGWDDVVGGYAPVSTVNPYMAVWVNAPEAGQLTLDPTPALAQRNGPLSRRNVPMLASLDDWQVQAKLTAGSSSDAWNFFGINPQASDSLGKEDGPEPPAALGGGVGLSFLKGKSFLARDMRPRPQGAQWNLQLSSDQERMGHLEFSGASALHNAGYQLVLQVGSDVQVIDDAGQYPVLLRKGLSAASIRAVPVGTQAALTGGLSGLRVQAQGSRLALRFNAPLSMLGLEATAELVGIDGKTLATARLASLAAGENALELSPGSLGKGVALVRVSAGGSSATAVTLIP